jgi:hypothetical protein
MYSNHEFIKQSDNDTVRSQRALAQAKRAPLLAPSLYRQIYRAEAPDILKQSSDILARALCGDLYHLDTLLHQHELKDLLDSFGSDSRVWNKLILPRNTGHQFYAANSNSSGVRYPKVE